MRAPPQELPIIANLSVSYNVQPQQTSQSREMPGPKFVLLKEGTGWVEERHIWSVLGAIVKDFLRPGDNRFPRDTKDFAQGINNVILDDFVLSKKVVKRSSKILSMDGVFDLVGRQESVAGLDLRGRRMVVRRLLDQDDFWHDLSSETEDFVEKVEQWHSEQQSWFGRPKGRVFWITGVLLAQQIMIAAETQDERGLTQCIELPIKESASILTKVLASGLPVDLSGVPNVVGKHSSLSKRSRCFSASAEDNYIIGVEVKEVVIKRKDGVTNLSTKDLKHVPYRHLGPDDDPGELVIVNVDESALDSILGDDEVIDESQEEVEGQDRT